MSYILEALKKSDAERKQAQNNAELDSALGETVISEAPKKTWAGLIAGTCAVVAVVGLGAAFVLNQDTAPTISKPQSDQKVVVAETPKPNPQPVKVEVQKADPIVVEIPKTVDEPVVEAVEVPVSKPTADPTLTADAYVDRAWGYIENSLYTQALVDLDLALAQEPAYAKAWFAHGWANEKNGNEQAAVQDYSKAIDAQPDHAFALFSRGFLNLYGGRANQAVVDFVRTQGVASDETFRLYSHLWLYLSRERAGQNGRARLNDDAKNMNLNIWPGPLVEYFQGTLEEAAVVKTIESSTEETRPERRATGYFFLGISQQLTGNAHNARAYFEKTLATGAVQFRQYDAARRELELLNR